MRLSPDPIRLHRDPIRLSPDTIRLIQQFYTQMLKQGKSPTVALRAAQLKLWQDSKWQNPYYWSAFTLQGEWR